MAETATETHQAQKRHRCDWCWQFVEVGEEYKRYRSFYQGNAGTVRMHPECYDAMQDAIIEEGGWLEWTPGQERPEKKTGQPQEQTDA